MPALLVTYKLNSPERDYAGLFSAIKNSGERWWHYLPDVWIVQTESDGADAFARRLFPHILKSDRLLVVRITSEHQGWLTADAWDWLNSVEY